MSTAPSKYDDTLKLDEEPPSISVWSGIVPTGTGPCVTVTYSVFVTEFSGLAESLTISRIRTAFFVVVILFV